LETAITIGVQPKPQIARAKVGAIAKPGKPAGAKNGGRRGLIHTVTGKIIAVERNQVHPRVAGALLVALLPPPASSR
jgi:hypothetical protein